MDFRILLVENELTYLNDKVPFKWFVYKKGICYRIDKTLYKEYFQNRLTTEITILKYE